jgi:predicted ferric reductase
VNRPRPAAVCHDDADEQESPMTAANQSLTRTGGRRSASSLARPAITARLVLWGVLAVNLVIVEILYWTGDFTKNAFVWIGQFLGLHLALVMAFQLVLVARLPFLDRRIGMDRLTSWHRWTGFTLFWLVLLHPTFILLGYSRLDRIPFLREFTNLSKQTPVLFGMIAAGLVIIVGIVSMRFARRRLQYETWHTVHFALYAVIVLAILHQLSEGSSFKTSPLAQLYWWAMWAFAIVSLIVGRIVLPLVRNARHQLRVAAVIPESDNVVSVYMTGRHLSRLQATAGQFFIWRFLDYHQWWQANPFSLSAAPDGASLRLTAKASGKTSASLRHLPIGTRVFAEGPYGAFTSLQRTRESTLLIAGGVGITPIRALLEELSGPIVVLYRVPRMADAVLLDELKALATMRGAQLHVLTGRTGEGNPPNNPFAPHNLRALVPDITERDVFVCGPSAMTAAVVRSLRELNVPKAQVHDERFSLAS